MKLTKTRIYKKLHKTSAVELRVYKKNFGLETTILIITNKKN